MNKSMLLKIINVLSVIPILIYPIILFVSIAAFDSPSSLSVLSFSVVSIILSYPVFIILLIYFSRKHNSLILASIALIPLLISSYVFFYFEIAGLDHKKDFDTRKKDFICDANSFLSFHEIGLSDGKPNDLKFIDLFEKKDFMFYTKYYSDGRVYDDKWVVVSNPKILSCKNSEGRSLGEIYTQIQENQVTDMLKKRTDAPVEKR